LQDQLQRAQVTAPRDGVALLDDPTEWVGKPVAVGERVMSVADAHEVEIEAWLSPSDAIELPPGSAVQLYLNSRPLSPVAGTLRYAAHEAVPRPDGSYAYRVRAVLPEGSDAARVGLKGTAKLSGGRVAAIYWVLRRPIASLRQMTGW
ncbi:MAG: HlyD family secretion protein, partial [Comamonadaceae bacterium]